LRADARPYPIERTHEIGARELAELHAEQRTGRLKLFARIEVLLHDLARGPRRERVAFG
jgi:hypothetical protein